MSDDLRIVEHEQDGVVTFYVATDLNPEEFPGAPTLGPFATRAEAETAAAEWDHEIDADAAADSAE
jgi:hypothetical protein